MLMTWSKAWLLKTETTVQIPFKAWAYIVFLVSFGMCVEVLQWTDLERKKLDRMLEGSIVYNSNSEEGYIVCSLNNMENSLFL
jgi:hypothetical protein